MGILQGSLWGRWVTCPLRLVQSSWSTHELSNFSLLVEGMGKEVGKSVLEQLLNVIGVGKKALMTNSKCLI